MNSGFFNETQNYYELKINKENLNLNEKSKRRSGFFKEEEEEKENIHIKKENEFVCPIKACGKKYKTSSRLEIHIRTHVI